MNGEFPAILIRHLDGLQIYGMLAQEFKRARRWICGVMVMVRLCIHNHGGEDGGGDGLWIPLNFFVVKWWWLASPGMVGGCELRREVGKGFVMDIIGKQCVCEDIIGVCDGQWVCCRPSPCSGGGAMAVVVFAGSRGGHLCILDGGCAVY
ncbi:hypothetical protein ACFE04_022751 [Oxalis oulophora]